MVIYPKWCAVDLLYNDKLFINHPAFQKYVLYRCECLILFLSGYNRIIPEGHVINLNLVS